MKEKQLYNRKIQFNIICPNCELSCDYVYQAGRTNQSEPESWGCNLCGGEPRDQIPARMMEGFF